jgi:CHAT domain-containing protein
MASGLLLTPPPAEPPPGHTDDDGALQAWEIFSQLRLRAELAVLSACQTGLGKNVAGEGLVGLTRALQYAGCRSVIASQWQVDDASTAALMGALHRGLRAGLAKDEALRRAMAAVRAEPRTAHPYYWAAFLLTGDPDNAGLGGRP